MKYSFTKHFLPKLMFHCKKTKSYNDTTFNQNKLHNKL